MLTLVECIGARVRCALISAGGDGRDRDRSRSRGRLRAARGRARAESRWMTGTAGSLGVEERGQAVRQGAGRRLDLGAPGGVPLGVHQAMLVVEHRVDAALEGRPVDLHPLPVGDRRGATEDVVGLLESRPQDRDGGFHTRPRRMSRRSRSQYRSRCRQGRRRHAASAATRTSVPVIGTRVRNARTPNTVAGCANDWPTKYGHGRRRTRPGGAGSSGPHGEGDFRELRRGCSQGWPKARAHRRPRRRRPFRCQACGDASSQRPQERPYAQTRQPRRAPRPRRRSRA